MKKFAIILFALSFGMATMAIESPRGKDKDSPKTAPSLTGVVIDQETGETLAGVAVKIDGSDNCVFTDFEGQFEITNLEPGKYNFNVSLISYKTNNLKEIELNAGDKKTLKVELKR